MLGVYLKNSEAGFGPTAKTHTGLMVRYEGIQVISLNQ
jgi:hypothetical protein